MDQHGLAEVGDREIVLLLVVVLEGDLTGLALLLHHEGVHGVLVVVDVLHSVDALVVASHHASVHKLLGNHLLHVGASVVPNHIQSALLHHKLVGRVDAEEHS